VDGLDPGSRVLGSVPTSLVKGIKAIGDVWMAILLLPCQFRNLKLGSDHRTLNSLAEMGYVDSLRFMLQNGINPNLKGHSGRTPLSFAAAGEHRAIVRLFL
jgi:ankyrin repeat protein